MSFEITAAHVKAYSATLDHLVQQQGSKLLPTIMSESVTGEEAYFDQIGKASVQKITDRHGDTPLNSIPHRRRQVVLNDYDTNDLFDNFDKIRTLADPTNEYSLSQAWALGRNRDSLIAIGASADAKTGKEGGDTTTFDSNMVVPVALSDSQATGTDYSLNVGKLRRAKKLLDAKNVPPGDRFFAHSAQQLEQLLGITSATSSDFASVKALVNGEINTFLGFTFVSTEELVVRTGNIRVCLAYHRRGLKAAIGGAGIMARLDPRPDKRYSIQAYARDSFGITRMQEDMVVEVLCDEDLAGS